MNGTNPVGEILAGQSGSGLNDDPELDSPSSEDDALDYSEGNSEDLNNPNLDDQQGEEDGEEGNPEDDEGEEENPKPKQKQNFKNLREKNKALSKQLDAFKEIVKLAKKNPEILSKLDLEDGEDLDNIRENLQDYSQDVQDIFRDIPIPKFKPLEKYKDFNELFIDIRNGIFNSMLMFQQKDRTQKDQITRSYEKRLGSIKTEFKDETTYSDFLDFAEEQLKKPYIKKLGPNALDAIVDLFNENRSGKPQKKVNPNKELSKNINKGARPSSGPPQAGEVPSQDYLRSRSMDEILSEQLEKRRG